MTAGNSSGRYTRKITRMKSARICGKSMKKEKFVAEMNLRRRLKMCYVIAKDINKRGCVAYKTRLGGVLS